MQVKLVTLMKNDSEKKHGDANEMHHMDEIQAYG
jgi:hypothetical protein